MRLNIALFHANEQKACDKTSVVLPNQFSGNKIWQ